MLEDEVDSKPEMLVTLLLDNVLGNVGWDVCCFKRLDEAGPAAEEAGGSTTGAGATDTGAETG